MEYRNAQNSSSESNYSNIEKAPSLDKCDKENAKIRSNVVSNLQGVAKSLIEIEKENQNFIRIYNQMLLNPRWRGSVLK